MQRFLKILLIVLFTVILSYNFCYAIDENITATQSNSSSSQTESKNSSSSNSSRSSTSSNAESGSSSSTTASVSRVDSVTDSGSSTISSIINIALIVIGLLLIAFAIAILIRLSNK